MGKALDFQKVRKKRQRSAAVKRLFLLSVIVLALAAAVFINNLLIEEGMVTRISDVAESFGGPGYPRALPGGVIRNVKAVGNNLAVLNDTNLYLYNKKGKQASNIQQMSENTVLLTSKDRILVYDVNSRKIAVHSVSKQLFSQELDDRITSVALGEQGNFAVITTPKQYVSSVTVYNSKYAQTFYWNSPARLMKEAALSPKGAQMVVACVDTDASGVLETSLHFFRLSSEEEQNQAVLQGELALELHYLSEDKLAVLTDSSYLVLSSTGSELGRYDFGNAAPVRVRRDGGNVLIQLEQKDTYTQNLVLLDSGCKELASLELERVRDMALGSKRIYVLTDTGIRSYNHSMELQEELELRGITRIHLVGNRLYYFTAEEICLLEGGSLAAAPAEESATSGTDFWSVEREESPAAEEEEEPSADGSGSFWTVEGEEDPQEEEED